MTWCRRSGFWPSDDSTASMASATVAGSGRPRQNRYGTWSSGSTGCQRQHRRRRWADSAAMPRRTRRSARCSASGSARSTRIVACRCRRLIGFPSLGRGTCGVHVPHRLPRWSLNRRGRTPGSCRERGFLVCLACGRFPGKAGEIGAVSGPIFRWRRISFQPPAGCLR